MSKSKKRPGPSAAKSGALGREGLGSLVRRPAVQLGLVAVAAVQVLAVSTEQPGVVPTSVLSPVVVQPAGEATGVAKAWQLKALERESQQLAARYRDEGYPVSQELAAKIHEAAVEYGIDPEVAFGLVRAESSFRNTATSPVGAVGLTQLMPSTARWMQPGVTRRELRNPDTNLRVGFKYLRYLLDKYEGDEDLALLAYNRGPGTVDRALKRGRSPDNGYAAFVRGEDDHGHSLYSR